MSTGRSTNRSKSSRSNSDLEDNLNSDDDCPAGNQNSSTKKSALMYLKNKSQDMVNLTTGTGHSTTTGASYGKPPRMRNMLRKKPTKVQSTSDIDERSLDDDSVTGLRADSPSSTRSGLKKKLVPQRGAGARLKKHRSTDDIDISSNHSVSESRSGGAKALFRNMKSRVSGQGKGGDGEWSGDDESLGPDNVETSRFTVNGLAANGRNLLKAPKLPTFLRRTKFDFDQAPKSDGSLNGTSHKGSGLRNRRTQSDGGTIVSSLGSTLGGSGTSNGTKGVSFSNVHVEGPPVIGNDDSEFGYESHPRTTKSRPQMERARYSVYHGQGTRAVKKKFRVRPFRAFNEPVYMTEEEIYADSLEPSKQPFFVKSYLIPTTRRTCNMDVPDFIRTRWGTPNDDGRIGSIRIEILGCVSLNRQKPDVCAYFVCGDGAFCTDVIQGYRSPMWPAACKRCAVFPIHHAYAKVYVGVFDVRSRTTKEYDNFCGRVVIDIANIRPDTEYDATMPLRASTFVYDKRKRGVVRIRFSLHWFSERAALLSYFRSVDTIDDKNPLVSGQPTIPCADPRTFRNVAFTVHGQDLPGKYSKVAFRSSIREMNLYQVNARRMVLVVVLDLMFYENKLVSFYTFLSSMYCVYRNSVSLVPAVCVGYVLIQYLNNYRHYITKKEFNFGYQPLTISEFTKSLFYVRPPIKFGKSNNNGIQIHYMKQIEVDKWSKRRANVDNKFKTITENGEVEVLKDDVRDIRPLDHREFPFSQRDAYPNFGVEDALAPGTTKGDTGRLHGRLSVYYMSVDSDGDGAPGAGSGAAGGDDDDSDPVSDHDDETVMSESQMMGDEGFDMESASDEDAESHLQGADMNYKRVALAQKMAKGKTRLIQRVDLGPPQDSDVKGKKVPPQVTLRKMEHMMYKFSNKISVEFVHSGPQDDENDADIQFTDTGMIQPSKELKSKMAQKAKKAQADEYDKILGLTVSYANPIQRIMSSFMGPVMRMMRVPIFIVRVVFNLSTWRDPYLSYWVLLFLVLLFVLLIIFPWRSFFFLTSFATMGPQNIFLRKFLEKRAREKETKKLEQQKGDDGDRSVSSGGSSSYTSKTGFLKKALGKSKKKKKSSLYKQLYGQLDPNSRLPFASSGQPVSSFSSKKVPPRSVAVPYSLLKKDRFYDWPPDPTVSRATPVPIYFNTQSSQDNPWNDDDSITCSGMYGRQLDDDSDDEDDNNNKNGNNNVSSKPRAKVASNKTVGSSGVRQRKPITEVKDKGFVPPVDIAF